MPVTKFVCAFFATLFAGSLSAAAQQPLPAASTPAPSSQQIKLDVVVDTKSGDPATSSLRQQDFTILDNSCADHTISVGTTCTFEVEFTPSTANQETGTLDIYGNTAANPQQIALQGTVSTG